MGSLSRVQRLLKVWVANKSSLTGISVSTCAIVFLFVLPVGVDLVVLGQIVLVFLFLLLLFQQWYIPIYHERCSSFALG